MLRGLKYQGHIFKFNKSILIKDKRFILSITLFIIAIISLSGLNDYISKNYVPLYQINMKRSYSDENERIAIQKCEALDIASILEEPRYSGFHSETNKNDPSANPTAYIWPNLVDGITLNFYQNKIKSLKYNDIKVVAYLHYTVKCSSYSNNVIHYNNISRILRIDEGLYSIDLFDYFYYITRIQYAIYNNTELEIITTNTKSIQINLSNGYIVRQNFHYTEYYAALAAFGGGAEQIIILDSDYNPKLIISKKTGGWIS
jgi:hypothetical protein